jgi:uncharacterized OsmC-like protein
MATNGERSPIVVTHLSGVKFAARVRSHRVLVDQSPRGGGNDEAPTPLELLAASLGTCVALYVQQFCHARDLPYEGMHVDVDTASATNPNRIAEFRVSVVLPSSLPPHYAEMIQRAARSCPAHNTLAHGAEVSVAIETAPTVTEDRARPYPDLAARRTSARTRG